MPSKFKSVEIILVDFHPYWNSLERREIFIFDDLVQGHLGEETLGFTSDLCGCVYSDFDVLAEGNDSVWVQV